MEAVTAQLPMAEQLTLVRGEPVSCPWSLSVAAQVGRAANRTADAAHGARCCVLLQLVCLRSRGSRAARNKSLTLASRARRSPPPQPALTGLLLALPRERPMPVGSATNHPGRGHCSDCDAAIAVTVTDTTARPSRVRRSSAFDFAARLIAATVARSAGPPTAACTAAAPPWSIRVPLTSPPRRPQGSWWQWQRDATRRTVATERQWLLR